MVQYAPPYLLRPVIRLTTPPKSAAPRTSLYLGHVRDCQTVSSSNAPNTGQILSSATPHKYNTVLLQIVTFSLNISLDSLAVRQLDSSDFPLRRIGFLGFLNVNLVHDTLLRRVILEQRCSWFFLDLRRFAPHCLVESEQRRGRRVEWRAPHEAERGPWLSSAGPEDGEHDGVSWNRITVSRDTRLSH